MYTKKTQNAYPCGMWRWWNIKVEELEKNRTRASSSDDTLLDHRLFFYFCFMSNKNTVSSLGLFLKKCDRHQNQSWLFDAFKKFNRETCILKCFYLIQMFHKDLTCKSYSLHDKVHIEMAAHCDVTTLQRSRTLRVLVIQVSTKTNWRVDLTRSIIKRRDGYQWLLKQFSNRHITVILIVS